MDRMRKLETDLADIHATLIRPNQENMTQTWEADKK